MCGPETDTAGPDADVLVDPDSVVVGTAVTSGSTTSVASVDSEGPDPATIGVTAGRPCGDASFDVHAPIVVTATETADTARHPPLGMRRGYSSGWGLEFVASQRQ